MRHYNEAFKNRIDDAYKAYVKIKTPVEEWEQMCGGVH